MTEIARYRSGYNYGGLLALLSVIFAIAVAVSFTGMIVFEDALQASGWRKQVVAAVIVFCVISPLPPIFLSAARHEWRLFADRLEIVERPTIPLLLRRRAVTLPFERLRVARSNETLVGVARIEIEDDQRRRFRLTALVSGGPGKWAFDRAGFSTFIGQVREAAEARRGPVPHEPLPSGWESAPGIAALALCLMVPVGTAAAAIWLLISRGSFGPVPVLIGALALCAVVLNLLRKSWRGYRAKRLR